MTTPNKAEIQKIHSDRDFWRAFGVHFGWRLYGFNNRSGATFMEADTDTLFEVSRYMHDSISAVVSGERE